ncbi:hypothetical protein BDV18DRAFT_159502 [Aspergillus unguis]
MPAKRKRAVVKTAASTRSRRLRQSKSQSRPRRQGQGQDEVNPGPEETCVEEQIQDSKDAGSESEDDRADAAKRSRRAATSSMFPSNAQSLNPPKSEGQDQVSNVEICGFVQAARSEARVTEPAKSQDISTSTSSIVTVTVTKPRRSPRNHQSSFETNTNIPAVGPEPTLLEAKSLEDDHPLSKEPRRCRRGHQSSEHQEPQETGMSNIEAVHPSKKLRRSPRNCEGQVQVQSNNEFKVEDRDGINDEFEASTEEEFVDTSISSSTATSIINPEPGVAHKKTRNTSATKTRATKRPLPTSSTQTPQTLTLPAGIDLSIPELVRSRPYSGPMRERSRLGTHLPPLHNLNDIFKSLTNRAIELGLDGVLNHLGDRKLRVATVCSGTESPLLALEMVKENLQKHFGRDLPFKHLFSAEIVPYKQAYIERNFHPRLIFRDVAELKERVAQTAYGALSKIPKKADILIAGFSCVDFSGLNNHRKALDESGESGGTFWGIVRHCAAYRPRLVILENVKTAPWKLIAQHWSKIGYVAVHADVDTKAYYLPQTRERGYMFCVDRKCLEKSGMGEEDVLEWTALLDKFKRPASSPAGMFLLDADDRRLEQLEKNMALRVEAQASSAKATVNWDRYQVRHQSYRLQNGLGHRRPISKSQDDGTCRMPDFAWQAWVKSLPERVWDTIDVNFLRKLIDGYDMNYKERCLELSQGLDREIDSRAYGIVGCITPTGIPYMTTRGGPLCGLESLALQGLPLDRLLLTQESQRDLQDLAGNAMSSTVVGAAILSALIVGRGVLPKGDSHTSDASLSHSQCKKINPLGEGGCCLVESSMYLDAAAIDDIPGFYRKAASSARLCKCEGQLSLRTSILRCTLCSHTSCSECSGNPQHAYERFNGPRRTAPSEFISLLQSALPARIEVKGLTRDRYAELQSSTSIPSEIWAEFLDVVLKTVGDELRFLDIKRSEVWTALYEGKHAVLKLVIGSGGMTWFLFAKPGETNPALCLIREVLSKPIARTAVPLSGSGSFLPTGNWEICAPLSSRCSVELFGSGRQIESYEAKCGLELEAFKNSKVWTHIIVQGKDEQVQDLEVDIRGTYELLQDCGTANGCLHRRSAVDGQPVVYLFLDPTKLSEPKNDSFVFSLEHSRNTGYSTRLSIAEVSCQWRSSKATDRVESVGIYYRKWNACPEARIRLLAEESDGHIECFGLNTHVPIRIRNHECHDANVTLLSFIMAGSLMGTTGIKGEWEITNPVDSPQILREYAWLLQKVARYTELREWYKLSEPGLDGPCSVCLPSKPGIQWGRDAKGRLKAYEDPYDAARYEREIKSRPAPFLVFRKTRLDGRAEVCVTLNLQTLLHQAYARLAAPQGASFHWRLAPNLCDIKDNCFQKFYLKSNKEDRASNQPPSIRVPLRPEQLRSLSWMIQQEDDDIEPFVQEETEEALLETLMWRAEGKVTVPQTVRGGILADDVGYGKTAIVLGLIDTLSGDLDIGLSAPLNDDGFISSKATLVVVPRIMVQQWQSEINKFLGEQYNVLTFNSVAALKKSSIEEIRDSDIVLVSWSVFDTSAYYQHLQKFTGGPEAPDKPGRNFDDWFHRAHSLMKQKTRILAEQGPRALLDSIRDTHMETDATGEYQRYAPSKRLRGRQYVLANRDRDNDVRTGVSYTEISSADENSEADEDVNVKVDKLLQRMPPNPPCEEAEDPEEKKAPKSTCYNWKELGVNQKGKNQHWETVKGLPFHAFHFKRLVIDEFTYAKAERLTQLLALQARSKWVLSGTPPLNDFTDVNTIAPFLGVHLGIDADDDANPSTSRLKDLRKQRTDAETFESFRAPRSEAWHRRRHELAQIFLDRFARKNVAEIDEIPSTEHIILVRQSAAEKAVYLELYKQLMQYNGQLRRCNGRGFDSDQAERLDEIILKSSSVEEALLKRCTSLAQGRWNDDGKPETATCESLIEIREEQLEKLKDELKKKLKLAAWVYCACDENDEKSSFDNFRHMIQRDFGDLSVTNEAYSLLNRAITTSSPDDWTFFFANPDTDGEDEEAETNPNETTTKSKNATILPTKPTQAIELKPILRNTSTLIRKLVVEWVTRTRALRFLKVVRKIQASPQDVPYCDRCQTHPRYLAGINILGSCGHALCPGCTLNTSAKEECVVEGCRGPGKRFNIINALTLGSDTSDSSASNIRDTDIDTSSRYGGTKLDALIDVLRSRVPSTERALLFIQFSDLMDIASKALAAANIEHTVISSADRAGCQKIEQFKKDGLGTNQVLLLNLGGEMAAGLNLQCANHIIFLSPLHAQTQYDYESTMIQAIGRCRRYGQTKHVHIYHFLAKRTIDVNIFQQRRGKVLIERDGEAVLVDAEEALDVEKLNCQGPEMVL